MHGVEQQRWVRSVVFAWLMLAGCGDDPSPVFTGVLHPADAGGNDAHRPDANEGGTGAVSGNGGLGGTGGTGGRGGTGGMSGAGGTGGAGGASGTGGTGGSAGAGGVGGTGGTSGTGGDGGNAGTAATGGEGGSAGSTGYDASVPCNPASCPGGIPFIQTPCCLANGMCGVMGLSGGLCM